ncbi:MAG: zinc-binding dehydrogenase [Candidatus Schekmanbacteria bacterium]|nr:zinc-binding dehydrogenase [Candidatus Schekmanbacteria bacterium]
MPHSATAWFLYPRRPGETDEAATLERDTLTLRDIAPHEALVEPLYGCWGGNMTHALQRDPVDICKLRREARVVLGNAAVVRVLEVGQALTGFRPGQLAMLFAASEVDRFGYMEKALAYDAPGTMGCLATRMVVRAHELLALPHGTRHELPRWAAFSGSSITAWANWELAYGTFRLQVAAAELPVPIVFGWGGGTTLAELDLARRQGCRTFQISSSEQRLELIRQSGITPVNRRPFLDLSFDESSFVTQPEKRRAYAAAEARFLREVDELTGSAGVNIFIDYIGTPVVRATIKALAREGVLATAGWREGMAVSHLRSVACIERHQHIHTHYARYAQGEAAVAYAERDGWLPLVDAPVHDFDEIPEMARRCAAGEGGFYTVFRVNPE